MPTYEYACTRCGTHVEVFQRFSDEPLSDCGVCGGPLRKVFHPAGIVFKGSGFYATDSRTSGSKKPSGEGGTADTAADKAGGADKGAAAEKGGSGKKAAKQTPSSAKEKSA